MPEHFDVFKRFIGSFVEMSESEMSDFIQHLMKNDVNKHIAIVAHKAPQFALEVLLNSKTWRQAIDQDWRKEKKWQPGWTYRIVDE